MYTEEEAKTKACCAGLGLGSHKEGDLPQLAACIGSRCMAWRSLGPKIEQKVIHSTELGFWKSHGYRYVVSYDDYQTLIGRCKSTNEVVGYCGLAGQP